MRRQMKANDLLITHLPTPDKSMLVDLGLACLARGEWQMVMAVTLLLRQEDLRHA